MQTFQELMTAELAAAGLSDEAITSALSKIYANDKLSPKLNALVKTATEDYNAQVGRLQQYQEWYPKAKTEYDRMAAEHARVTAELQALQGNPQGQPPAFDPTKYVSKDDLIAMQANIARNFAPVLKDAVEITADHVVRFKERPDMNAIDKLATEQGIPLKLAYEKYIEPRVKEQEKVANEEWKKQQREEIERDLRSRYQLPTEQVAPETAPLYRTVKPEDAPKDMDAELMAAWRSVPAKA